MCHSTRNLFLIHTEIFFILDGIKAQMAHAKAVNRKKNWDDDDPEGTASGLNTPITGKYLKLARHLMLLLQ